MASRYVGTVILKGADGATAAKRYDLGLIDDTDLETEFAAAVSNLEAIASALDLITDATIMSLNIQYVSPTAGGAGGGDLFNGAMINVYSLNENDDEALQHFAQVTIPAASDGIFVGTTGKARNQVDVNDTQLIAYINALALYTKISDGETIQVSEGEDGMDSGKRKLLPRILPT